MKVPRASGESDVEMSESDDLGAMADLKVGACPNVTI